MESQSLCAENKEDLEAVYIDVSGEKGRGIFWWDWTVAGGGETQLDPPANEMAPHMLAQMKSRRSLKKGGHAMFFYFWRRNWLDFSVENQQ